MAQTQPQVPPSAPLCCVECGYELRGLPAEGRCPECGTLYSTSRPEVMVKRPPFGWLLLVLPALVTPVTWTIASCDLGLLAMSVVGAPLTAIILIMLTAEDLAAWRYAVAAQRAAPGAPLPDHRRYMWSRTIAFALVQLCACVLAFFGFLAIVPWLATWGVFPRGWS